MAIDSTGNTHAFRLIGNELTPVIVVDNALSDIDLLRREILGLEFGPPTDSLYYPGVRAMVHQQYARELSAVAEKFIRERFNLNDDYELVVGQGYYSLLTKNEDELIPEQCMPHFDNPEPNNFAVLHYLNEGDFGGTGFYRHKLSGFEKISVDRVSDYVSSVNKSISEQGMPQSKYISESDHLFELVDKVDYVANRLVIYPTSILHSGFIDAPKKNICKYAEAGRLTANFFYNFKLDDHDSVGFNK